MIQATISLTVLVDHHFITVYGSKPLVIISHFFCDAYLLLCPPGRAFGSSRFCHLLLLPSCALLIANTVQIIGETSYQHQNRKDGKSRKLI